MNGLLTSLMGATAQGVLWGIMALGVYITYKLLKISDLTVDGSFALGGCVCAVLILGGMSPALATLIAIIAGLAAEGFTVVDDIVYIQRGYERFEDKLRSLGAEIERVSSEKEIQKFQLRIG